MQNLRDHIVFAGGGTAGHLFPGLAVAELLRRDAPELGITFAGTGKPLEIEHVGRAGYDYAKLPCRPFPERARDAWQFVKDNVRGYYAAMRLLRATDAALVVGLGGYASVPAARAASKLGIPYILLEQNAVPGRATRWLANKAALICSAFDTIGEYLPGGCRVRVTGNPLRQEFSVRRTTLPLPADASNRPRLLIVGGSGGAQVLNEQVPRALYKSREAIGGWEIVHQSGERGLDTTRERYRKLGIEATVVPFANDLPRLLAETQLVIGRAGGTTLAELSALGVPAIVLPYPHATDDHQRKNADVLAAAGGVVVIDEREIEGRLDNHLAALIGELAPDRIRRARMSACLLRVARPEAAQRVARAIAKTMAKREATAA